MSQLCGVPNRSRNRPWNCRRKVRSSPCWQHGGGAAYLAPSSWWESTASAAFVADVLTDGLNATLAGALSDRVTQYLGVEEKQRLYRRLRRWRRKGVDCELLAEAARAVLRLKRQAHELVGEAVSDMFDRLLRDLSRFQRLLVKKVVAKLPLPWDVKLAAIARGLQVIGIWMCLVQELPLERCPCLQMLSVALVKERIEQEIKDLLDATQRDLQHKLTD
jgi:hypothetical protein